MPNLGEFAQSNEIGRLVLQGKEKGYITYEEVNSALPSNFIAPEQIDGLMNLFGANEIHVVDSEAAGKKIVSENVSFQTKRLIYVIVSLIDHLKRYQKKCKQITLLRTIKDC